MRIIIEQLEVISRRDGPTDQRTGYRNLAWKACVRTSPHCDNHHDAEVGHAHVEITDPFDHTNKFDEIFRKDNEHHGAEKDFLAEHVNKSLDRSDCNDDGASKASEILSLYGRSLIRQIGFQKIVNSTTDREVEVEVTTTLQKTTEHCAQTSIQQLLWEVLENQALLQTENRLTCHRITLRRRLVHDQNPSSDGLLQSSDELVPRTVHVHVFNILVVIARRRVNGRVEEADRWSPVQLLNALFKVQKDLWWRGGSLQIHLEVVRPGSFEELKQHLARRENFFQAVHFDVHGLVPPDEEAVLEFNVWNELERDWETEHVNAARIAEALSHHSIQCLILGACKSAHVDAKLSANLSWQFVQAGIPNVVAMSFNMSDSMAYIFFQAFYHSLLIEQLEIGEAARSARLSLAQKKQRYSYETLTLVKLEDWFVPVAYSRGDRLYVKPNSSLRNWVLSRNILGWCFAPQQVSIRMFLWVSIFVCWLFSHIADSVYLRTKCPLCRPSLAAALADCHMVLFLVLKKAVRLAFSDVQNYQIDKIVSRFALSDRFYRWTPSQKVAAILLVWLFTDIYCTILPWYQIATFIKRVHRMIDDKQNVLRIEGSLRRSKVIIVYQDFLTAAPYCASAQETLSTIFEIWRRTNCIDHVVVQKAEWLLNQHNRKVSLMERLQSSIRWWSSDITEKYRKLEGCHPRTVFVVENMQSIHPADKEDDLPHHQKSRQEFVHWVRRHFAQQVIENDMGTPYLVLTWLSSGTSNGLHDENEDFSWLKDKANGLEAVLRDITVIKFTAVAEMNILAPKYKALVFDTED